MGTATDDDPDSQHDESNPNWILTAYQSLEPRNYLHEFTRHHVRPCGRPFLASRSLSVHSSFLQRNSYGSASVSLGLPHEGEGQTQVLAACVLSVGRPGAATPLSGEVDVMVRVSPLASPRWDSWGKERQLPSLPFPTVALDAKALESFLRRILRTSQYLDPLELSIVPGKAAWRVKVVVDVLNAEGNLFDAALVCVCAALRDLRLPKVQVLEDEGSVVRIVKEDGERKSMGKTLTLGPPPIPFTVAILPQSGEEEESSPSSSSTFSSKQSSLIMVVDPTQFEEDLSCGNSLTVVCNTHNQIINLQKRGSASTLSLEQIEVVVGLGMERAKEWEAVFFPGGAHTAVNV